MLVNALFEALQKLEPDLRKIVSNEHHTHASATISIDPDGATYSWVVSDGHGQQESRSKRVPSAKTIQMTADARVAAEAGPPMPTPPPVRQTDK
jgi:hypothetical protein